jgi:TolA-binding protein
MKPRIICCAIFVFAGMLNAAEGDYEKGEAAYLQGAYQTAEVFFQNMLKENPQHARVPDAMFYLIKIYEHRENIPALLGWVERFLTDCSYDNRRQDVFTLTIERLLERNAYALACDFLHEYDFFVMDQKLLEEIGFGLVQENNLRLADSVLARCAPSDTVNILRARLAETRDERRYFYELVGGEKGRLYIIEMLLASGDTVQAFDVFRAVDRGSIHDDMLFRFARIALLFDEPYFATILDRLGQEPAYRQKTLLLRALHAGELNRSLIPHDVQECSLLVATMKRGKIEREDFSGMLGGDTISLDSIVNMKSQYGSHFMLDSLHAEKLIALGDTAGALRVIAPYIRYANTTGYARTIRGMDYYNNRDYQKAATHFLLAQVSRPRLQFMLARSLNYLGMDAAYLYEQVLKSMPDTILLSAATAELITIQFARGEYDRVIEHDPEMVRQDTGSVRKYIYSLARRGQREKADMWCSECSMTPDDKQSDYYGEYLIEAKNFKRARAYYDSLVEASAGSSLFLYNWALVPFMQGDLDTAQARFLYYLNRFPGADECYRAAFKLATILYLEEQFDSAASLYGIASEDETLSRDALQNQLICYKKSGSWFKVVKTGMEILAMNLHDDEHETRFEIGYAWLRAGRPERAIEHLLMSVRTNPTPEYYYWLAEAYLAKADFSRALYFYQRIVHEFPRDEMWTPTAQYKTGIVLEFMDAHDEAKAVYRTIIKTRGAADTWGVEALRRIEYLEQ